MENIMLRLSAKDRIDMIVDEGSFKEICSDIKFNNPLDFEGYEEKFRFAEQTTGLKEAVVIGYCSINDYSCMLIVRDSCFSHVEIAKC